MNKLVYIYNIEDNIVHIARQHNDYIPVQYNNKMIHCSDFMTKKPISDKYKKHLIFVKLHFGQVKRLNIYPGVPAEFTINRKLFPSLEMVDITALPPDQYITIDPANLTILCIKDSLFSQKYPSLAFESFEHYDVHQY